MLEDAQQIAEEIRAFSESTTRGATELKAILRGALEEFEEALKPLPAEQRDAALRLFLNVIRERTFTFRIAVLGVINKSRLLENPTRENMEALVENYDDQLGEIAQIYRFLP